MYQGSSQGTKLFKHVGITLYATVGLSNLGEDLSDTDIKDKFYKISKARIYQVIPVNERTDDNFITLAEKVLKTNNELAIEVCVKGYGAAGLIDIDVSQFTSFPTFFAYSLEPTGREIELGFVKDGYELK